MIVIMNNNFVFMLRSIKQLERISDKWGFLRQVVSTVTFMLLFNLSNEHAC